MRTRKRGAPWRRPNWAGQQPAVKVTNSVIQEESCSAFNSHPQAAHCVWTLSWHGSWLLCSIDFLCHRQYYCSWKVHYFFKLPYSEKGIFFEGFCHISLENRKSVICIFLCMFTGTKKKKEKKKRKKKKKLHSVLWVVAEVNCPGWEVCFC